MDFSFLTLAVMNNGAVNTMCTKFCMDMFSLS